MHLCEHSQKKIFETFIFPSLIISAKTGKNLKRNKITMGFKCPADSGNLVADNTN